MCGPSLSGQNPTTQIAGCMHHTKKPSLKVYHQVCSFDVKHNDLILKHYF